MKLRSLFFICSLPFVIGASGFAADKITETFQKGLFEEEANRNLPAAIEAYQTVIKELDQQRRIAASAIFRLGESYRKLGKTNEAAVQFQRIVREFGDQEPLAKLSQQNLVALGIVKPAGPDVFKPVAVANTNEEQRQIEQIKTIIKDSPDLINSANPPTDPNAQTRLESAARSGHLTVAKFLIENKAEINPPGRSPLLNAVRSGHKTMTELLIAHGAKVNVTVNGSTPLIEATQLGFKSIAELLLEHGAAVDSREGDAATALMFAALNGFNSLAETLISKGADLNARATYYRDNQTYQDWTPLHFAVYGGHKNIVESLLKVGAPVNARDNQGTTPLLWAFNLDKIEIAELLIQNKADPNIKGRMDGTTPLISVGGPRREKLVRLLLEQGANPNEGRDSDGITPLGFAAMSGRISIAELLLAHKADPNKRFTDGTTALFKAIANNRTEMAEFLLKHGADPDLSDANGNIPLHYTLSQFNKPMLELLLNHHADVNARNSSGQTALAWIKEYQNPPPGTQRLSARPGQQRSFTPAPPKEIEQLLRKHGASEDIERRETIQVGRGASYQSAIFHKGPRSMNRHTLLELIAVVYGGPPASPLTGEAALNAGLRAGATLIPAYSLAPAPNTPLPFPDLTKITIDRLAPDGKHTRIPVNLEAILLGGESKDVFLEWGDRVEIPEAEHPLNAPWPGFGKQVLDQMILGLTRTVTVLVKGESITRTLKANIQLGMASNWGKPSLPELRLTGFLRNAGVLYASSDQTKVRVKRVDPVTKQNMETLFNLEETDPKTDLWLRDGDVIEVPEKK